MRDDSTRRDRWFPAVVIVVLLAILAAGTANNLVRNPQPRLVADGVPIHGAAQAAGERGELMQHAIADLDALTLPSGATLAGWDGPWRFVWPRDASFVAAARCSIGQYDQADRVLHFLDGVRPSSGRWEARYSATGEVIRDGREPQLDGSGWVLWATWFCRAGGKYWDLVRESADEIVAVLTPDGLPAPSPDYWERPESKVTLGVVAPLLTGLRSAIRIATQQNHADEAARWRTALDELSRATDRAFGPDYPRTPARAVSFLEPGLEPIGIGGGADAIVTVLGPPFAPAREVVSTAINRTRGVLTQPNGGVTPGEDWRTDGVAWTPQTALFALSAAARGDRATAESLLSWLDRYRTRSGALPEKVNRDLEPAGEAPLGWTSALVVLTGAALQKPLPIPG
ncbi:glucoamylase [Kribbella capetownensis]|uniref:Glucoamylase n=1 Tax=Kribbella capetownensis TaxID=1572659 RepID=A0A4R0K578_9ACTN|nr:glucoamylase [Kribbella capetownensis]TCC50125.1 glucoamylase [Kribbella capetownensis]